MAHLRTREALLRADGFTLLEAVIAISVFSIGLMAAVSMEFIALNAYTAARDTTQATEIARRVVAMTNVEALNWESSNGLIPPNANDDTVYVSGTNSPFDPKPILALVTENPWVWAPLTVRPVDENMSLDNTRRFCVFVRGDFFRGSATAVADAMGDVRSPLIQTQVAVVFPGSGQEVRADVATCDELFDACPDPNINDALEPVFDVSLGASPAERCGLRVVRSASLVQKVLGPNT